MVTTVNRLFTSSRIWPQCLRVWKPRYTLLGDTLSCRATSFLPQRHCPGSKCRPSFHSVLQHACIRHQHHSRQSQSSEKTRLCWAFRWSFNQSAMTHVAYLSVVAFVFVPHLLARRAAQPAAPAG